MNVAVRLEPHLDELRVHAKRRPLDSSTAPQAEIAGTRLLRSARIVVAFGLRESVRPAGSASVLTDQRSMPQPTCFELGAVVFAGARPAQAKGTTVTPRMAIASPVRLEIRI